MNYNSGDTFVSTKFGVVFLIEETEKNHFKCNIYDKQKLHNTIQILNKDIFDMWRDHQIYKFYPSIKN